jgi:hypothetical protein
MRRLFFQRKSGYGGQDCCHEMESWLLGDLKAVEKAYNISGLSRKQQQRKYRNPTGLIMPLRN